MPPKKKNNRALDPKTPRKVKAPVDRTTFQIDDKMIPKSYTELLDKYGINDRAEPYSARLITSANARDINDMPSSGDRPTPVKDPYA